MAPPSAANSDGGAILDMGNLVLNSDLLTLNRPTGLGSKGGAVAVEGSGSILTAINSTFSGNNSAGDGGALFNGPGCTMSITNSAITGNRAFGNGSGVENHGTLTITTTALGLDIGAAPGGNFGGGVNNEAGATVTIISSSVVGCASLQGGGGLNNAGTATILNSSFIADTVTSATGPGGASISNTGMLTIGESTITAGGDSSTTATAAGNISNTGTGTVLLNNSIVAEGTTANGTSPDISGMIASTSANNFIGASDGSNGLTNGVNGNQVGTLANPINDLIGVPSGNGANTVSRVPLPGSTVIGTGNPALVPASLTTDQRGFPRIVAGKVDIGSVELQPPTTSTALTVTATSGSAPSATLTATVSPAVPGAVTPSGTVTFYTGGTIVSGILVGGTQVGTADLNANGVATLTVSTPRAYQFTAQYGGNLALGTFGSTSSQVSQTLGTANQIYVSYLFQTLLNRPVDSGGLSAFSSMLDAGVSKPAVVLGIESSPEYIADQVQALYQQYLHRPADPTGLSSFSAFLAGGGTLEQAAAMLAGSAEYFLTRGQNNNTTFLQALYQDALGRPIDPAGQAGFSQQLANGVSRSMVAAEILASPEYRTNLVQGYYMHFLGRQADPGGLNAFVGQLQAGITDQVVISMIAGSQEAFNRAQTL
jgi:hypothetical protein